jgi:hypothetical protein
MASLCLLSKEYLMADRIEQILELHANLAHQTLALLTRVEKQLAATHSVHVHQEVRNILSGLRYKEKKRVVQFGWKGQSQFDEDGILEEIFNRIGIKHHKAVEIGAGDGLENNTIYLLQQGWQCVWVEAIPDRVAFIRSKFKDADTLSVVEKTVQPDTVNGLFDDLGEIDLWTLDIDGNDYWVFEAFDNSKNNPRVIMLEYNAKFKPPMEWAKSYDPHHKFDKSDYMGASLQSLTRLADEKGYALVGCGVTGANAYYVRKDLLGDLFQKPYTAENHYEPGRYWLARGYYSGMPENNFGKHLTSASILKDAEAAKKESAAKLQIEKFTRMMPDTSQLNKMGNAPREAAKELSGGLGAGNFIIK